MLSKDSFLLLLMTQLKYQDPTSPMDTDKMIAQTADMAVIEAQENIQKEMENMIAQFKQTSAYQLVGAVGKLADTGLNAIKFTSEGAEYKDFLYYEDDFTNGVLSVVDDKGNLVRSMVVENGFKGLREFVWDGKNSAGVKVGAGVYSIYAEYTGANTGKSYKSDLGVYPIESVVLDQATPRLYLGGEYYTLDQIRAIKDRV
jgi:flagellar basal-body rod modification protein FlgD